MVTAAPPTRKPTTFPYVESLDGLRGLFVLPVMVFHFSLTAGWNRILAPGAFFAPSAFFALSGFLITSLLLAERERTGELDGRGFWSRRFRRLLPSSVFVVLFAVFAGVLVPTAWAGLTGADVVAALFSVQNWWSIHLADTGQVFQLLGPLGTYWSLAVEEQFYLILFGLMLLASRTRNMVRWLTVLLIALGTYSILSLVLLEGSPQREFFGTDTRASEVVAGCLLGVAVHHWGWPRGRWWGAAGWTALVVTLLAWGFVWEDDGWVLAGGLALISIVNVFLIGGAVVPGTFQRAMRWKPLVHIGRISYPLYLIHWPLGVLLSPERLGVSGLPLIGARFVVCILAADGINRFLEKPLRTSRLGRWPLGFALWVGCVAVAIGIVVARTGWT